MVVTSNSITVRLGWVTPGCHSRPSYGGYSKSCMTLTTNGTALCQRHAEVSLHIDPGKYDDPYYRDPRKGIPNVGKSPCRISINSRGVRSAWTVSLNARAKLEFRVQSGFCG